jgi:uncharacterized protein YcfL
MKKSIILISALSMLGLLLVSCSSEPETIRGQASQRQAAIFNQSVIDSTLRVHSANADE